MIISKDDQERISGALNSAEAKTSSEIVCVLARTSTPATTLPVLIAVAVALALPWPLVTFTAMTVHRILSLQALVFLLILLVLTLPRIRVALIPRKARRAIAHRAAMEQFLSHGVGRTKDHAGVLIFVSLAERYARIITDDDIAARVPQSEWQAAVNALIVHMRDGHIANGFITAIDLCGSHLAKHFPRSSANKETRPPRIYLI